MRLEPDSGQLVLYSVHVDGRQVAAMWEPHHRHLIAADDARAAARAAVATGRTALIYRIVLNDVSGAAKPQLVEIVASGAAVA